MMNKFSIRILTSGTSDTSIFYMGQAGYIIKSRNGQLLGVDLYFSDCVERVEGHMGFKRLQPKLMHPYELEFDCLIATHPHYDHFDFDAIPELLSNRKTRLFASVNCEKEVRKIHMENENIVYVRPGDCHIEGDFKIDFLECDHGTGAPDAVSVMITVDGKRVYMAGDTCFRPDRVSDILKDGNVDYLIGPINGAYGNMNEHEFAELSKLVKPKLTIPSHYGMFAAHGGNPGVFIEEMNSICSENAYILLAQGERLKL